MAAGCHNATATARSGAWSPRRRRIRPWFNSRAFAIRGGGGQIADARSPASPPLAWPSPDAGTGVARRRRLRAGIASLGQRRSGGGTRGRPAGHARRPLRRSGRGRKRCPSGFRPGGVLDWIKRLHNNLLLPEWGGRQAAGWFGVGLLLLTLIGIQLWWPAPGRWRNGFTVPRRARGLRLHRALHGAAGAWLVLMLLATSVTGIVQGFPQASRALLGLPPGGPARRGAA